MSGRGYIGGGSIAAILGLSPYQTPLHAYFEITGEQPQEIDVAQRRFFDRRKAWEPTACMLFEQSTGVRIVKRNERYDDPEFPWAKAEIDFETEDGCNGETKTINPRIDHMADWGDPQLGEEPPLWVMAQVQWGLGVTGKEGCYVHGMLGLDDDLIYHVDRDEVTIREIRRRAHDFWRFHIEPHRPPQAETADDIKRLFPRDSGRSAEATPEIARSWMIAAEAKAKMRLNESDYERHALAIKMHMRDATTLTYQGKPIVRWKADARGTRIFKLI